MGAPREGSSDGGRQDVNNRDAECFDLTRSLHPGVPVSSRVSTKIQQLLNTLKRPKRPPLKEFFVDDFEEIVEGNSIK